jgi:hypothetical protein
MKPIVLLLSAITATPQPAAVRHFRALARIDTSNELTRDHRTNYA